MNERRFQIVLLVGLIVVSLNLRPAISSVPPLIEAMRAALQLSYSVLSLLTTIPLVCMGVFALAAPSITRTIGREQGVFWGLVLVGVATAIRLWGYNSAVLLASTVLVGIGIAIVQTLIPPLISVYFPGRVAFATGLHTASLSFGAMLGTAFTAPIRTVFDSWPIALAIWSALAILGIATWIPVLRGAETDQTTPDAEEMIDLPYRDPLAWKITIYYGGQAAIFFSLLTWFPPRYVVLGWSETDAGLLLTVFFLLQLVAMFAVSAFADRTRDRRPWLIGAVALIVISSTGVALVPEAAPWLWAALLGAGSGANFMLALVLPVDFATDPAATDKLTSMTLAGGYLLSAVGPLVFGGIQDVFGSYVPTFIGIVIIGVALLGLAVQLSPCRAETVD